MRSVGYRIAFGNGKNESAKPLTASKYLCDTIRKLKLHLRYSKEVCSSYLENEENCIQNVCSSSNAASTFQNVVLLGEITSDIQTDLVMDKLDVEANPIAMDSLNFQALNARLEKVEAICIPGANAETLRQCLENLLEKYFVRITSLENNLGVSNYKDFKSVLDRAFKSLWRKLECRLH